MNRPAKRTVIAGAGLVLAALAAGPAMAATSHTAAPAKSRAVVAHLADPSSGSDKKSADPASKDTSPAVLAAGASTARVVGSVDTLSKDPVSKDTTSTGTASVDRASVDRPSIDRPSIDRPSLDR